MSTSMYNMYHLLSNKQYKCIQGVNCSNENCTHVHPGEVGYYRTPYLLISKKCRYETEETACRKKCGSKNGRYCPFFHCNHEDMVHLAITCIRQDCQAHCPMCF
jgi:hypothetical protein